MVSELPEHAAGVAPGSPAAAASRASGALAPPGPGGVLKLVATAALMASAFVAIKVAVTAFTPVQVAALRTGGAAIAVALWMWLTGRHGAALPRGHWPATIFVGLVGYALPFVLVAWAEQRLPSALAGLLMSSGPLAAAALAPLLAPDERPSARRLLGLGIGALGVALALAPGQVPSPDSLDGSSWGWWLRGLAVVGAAVCYALAGFATRRIPLSPDAITRRALIVAAVALAPAALALRPAPGLAAASDWPLGPTLALLYLALVPTALSYVVRFRLIVRHGYTFVSFTGYLVPVLSLVFGALLLSERPGFVSVLALVLIVLGILVCQRSALRR